MVAARNGSRKTRRSLKDPQDSLITVGNERLTGLFRWTLLIFAVILNNLSPSPLYDQNRINIILALWGVVCLSTLLLLFLHRAPGRAFSYTTTAVDMLVAAMITYASGGYTSPFSVLFFLVISVSALRFGAIGSILCALVVALLYMVAGAVAPLQQGTYLATVTFDRVVILQHVFLFVVVAVLGSVMARALSAHREVVTRRDVEAKLMTEVNMALANAIEAKDSYTRGHSERLAKLAGACAERMNLSRDEVGAVRLGAILHDVGKIGIPDRILRQSMSLTEDEMAWMRRHPQIGADIIGPVEGLHHVSPLIRHHHEKWDGTGYPNGLKGEGIPLGSRIIAVADAFEAMVADRIYRPSLGLDKALQELRDGRGTHFDPQVVDTFLDLIAHDTVHLPLPTKDEGQRPLPARPDEAPAQSAA
ncbi:MAG TPA: HD-GYP domain-containing protein [Candidatus Limnocylindrales bacterium]|nr:HD-GYP domain-containing protein [Candidatus Limnocylindrales bacterium]